MIIFPRFGKYLARNTDFSALITELLQRVQILPNNFAIKNILPFIIFTIILFPREINMHQCFDIMF